MTATKAEQKTGQKSQEAHKVQCLDDIKNSDFTAGRNEFHFRTPVLVDKLSVLLKDQRDVPMLCLMLNIAEYLAIAVPLLYGINMWHPQLPLLYRNLAGLAYLVTLVLLFQERFLLMLHFASHRSIFHNNMLNSLNNYVFSNFFGVPCGVYKLHHTVMHHIENNHGLDASATEQFQRDSLMDFAAYWFRFVVRIWYDLAYYTVASKKWAWLGTLGCGLVAWVSTIYVLATYVNFLATMWVLLIPYCFAMSVMSFGNWAQHVFVNPEDCMSNYGLTYNCLDTPVNQTTFNDGYHVIHHLNARLHWTEIPDYFYQTREKHVQNGALTFRGVHFMDVGMLVMTGQLRKLAEKYYVHIGPKDTAPSAQEVEAKLRAWVKPVPLAARQAKAKHA